MIGKKWQHLIGKKIKDVQNDYPGTVLSDFKEGHTETDPGNAPVVYDFDASRTIHPVPYYCLLEQ